MQGSIRRLLNWRIAAAVSFLILLFIAFFFITATENRQRAGKNGGSLNEFNEDLARWKNEINRLGGVRAYELFKREAERIPSPSQRHGLAHIFGLALYKTEGLPGIEVCDNSFVYGCYHSFLSEAIKENGIGVVKELSDVCVAKFGEDDYVCRHGLGHGIVGHAGYSKKDILDALKVCSGIAGESGLSGCASGVFMEYNMRTMVDPSGTGRYVREYEGDPFYPCNAVAEEFLPSCYKEQPNWWKHVFDWDYKKIGELCFMAPSSELTGVCVQSLGSSSVINYNYDAERVSEVCSYMPNEKTSVSCIFSAAATYVGRDISENGLVSSLCRNFSGDRAVLCKNAVHEGFQTNKTK